MKYTIFLLLVATLGGCSAKRKAVVPALEGKPRIRINKQVPPPVASTPVLVGQ